MMSYAKKGCRPIALCLLAIAPTFATVPAQDAATKIKTPLDALRAEYEEASQAWQKKYRGDRGTPADQLIERFDQWPAWSFLPRFVKLGTEDPTAPYAFDALKWYVVELSNGVGAGDREIYVYEAQVFRALREHHLSNPGLVGLFGNSSFYPTPQREQFLRDCMAEGPTRDVRGLAC